MMSRKGTICLFTKTHRTLLATQEGDGQYKYNLISMRVRDIVVVKKQ
jgi:hypothetical protein